jgi:hypothetical protein
MQCETAPSIQKRQKRVYNKRVECEVCLRRRAASVCSVVRTTRFHAGKVSAPSAVVCAVCKKRERNTTQCAKCRLDVQRFKGVGGVCVACLPVPVMIRRLKANGLFETVLQIARHNNVQLDRDGNPPDWFFVHHRLTSMGDVRVCDLVQMAEQHCLRHL